MAAVDDVDLSLEELRLRFGRGALEAGVPGFLLADRAEQGLQPRLRLLDADAWLATRVDLHPAEAAVVDLQPGRADLRLHRDGHEDVGRDAQLEAVEAARRDADHGERVAVDLDRLAEDVVAAGEAPAPVVVAEDRERVAGDRVVVRRREEPADRGLHAQDLEVVARDELAVGALADILPADVHLREDPADHAVEAGCLVVEIAEQRPRQLGAVAEGAAVVFLAIGVDLDQLGGPLHRQRPQRDLVQQGEHRGVGADAERDRDDRDDGEERRAGEAAGREAQVGEEVRHAARPVRAACQSRGAGGRRKSLIDAPAAARGTDAVSVRDPHCADPDAPGRAVRDAC